MKKVDFFPEFKRMNWTVICGILFLVLANGVLFAQKTGCKGTMPWSVQAVSGNMAELFCPGLFSTDFYEYNLCFTPGGKEIYYGVLDRKNRKHMIYHSDWNGTTWTQPKPFLMFDGRQKQYEPFLSPDGNRLYYVVPAVKKMKQRDADIWFVERKENGWGEPVNLGSPVNTGQPEGHPKITHDGDLIYTVKRNGKSKVFLSKKENGAFQQPVEILKHLTEIKPRGPVLSKDGKYIIFYSKKIKGYGGYDLFVTFKNRNGLFGVPVNLGKNVNTEYSEANHTISPDGKYLFFSRKGDIYRVSLKIVEDFKKEVLD